ncbi:MAG: glycoside hydrolase family 3 C-terminal domain-containing protein, partial [bacterium]
GVGTSLKHFAVNNQETQRMTISAEVDERTLYEMYLAGFERAIRKSNPWTVMCAYNRVNGVHASEHRQLLTEILRDEWGYEGVVVSDWGAVHDRVKALGAGLDLEMPGPQQHRAELVVEAVQNGRLDESILDRSVKRLLGLVAKATNEPKPRTTVDTNSNHALARRIAGEAIVLLKNEGNLLPLESPDTLAVIGLAAQQPHYQGGGSSRVNPTQVDVPLEELRMLAGKAELSYAPGYMMEEGFDQTLIDEAVVIARKAEVALLYIALPQFKESEGYDRPDIDLTEQQVALIKAVSAVQPQSVVILNNGSAVAMQDWIDQVPTVIEAWLMGQAGGGAIADVLFGLVNPSGRLAETFPSRREWSRLLRRTAVYWLSIL